MENTSAWVDEGSPMDALKTMLQQPVVLTEDFHGVYARLRPLMTVQPRLAAFMEDQLYVDSPYDWELLKKDRMSTVSPGERFTFPKPAIFEEEAAAEWVVANISLETRLKFAEKSLSIRY